MDCSGLSPSCLSGNRALSLVTFALYGLRFTNEKLVLLLSVSFMCSLEKITKFSPGSGFGSSIFLASTYEGLRVSWRCFAVYGRAFPRGTLLIKPTESF